MYVGGLYLLVCAGVWWGGKIDPENPKIISVYDALKPKLGENFTLGYERGCDWSATNETAIIREGDPRTERLNMMLWSHLILLIGRLP